MKKIAAGLISAVLFLSLASCEIMKGSIIIKENIAGTGCEIEFSQWSEKNKCELSLNQNDKLSVEIICDSGTVALDIRGKNGAKVYSGNGLKTCEFTVEVPETGDYVINIEGEKASGSIDIRNISR